MKIRPMEAVLSHADGQTDRHDAPNSSFSQLCESTQKTKVMTFIRVRVIQKHRTNVRMSLRNQSTNRITYNCH